MTLGEMRNAYKILIGKPEEKRPIGGPRRRWETGCEDVDWIQLA
jgi:hypothetical protein